MVDMKQTSAVRVHRDTVENGARYERKTATPTPASTTGFARPPDRSLWIMSARVPSLTAADYAWPMKTSAETYGFASV